MGVDVPGCQVSLLVKVVQLFWALVFLSTTSLAFGSDGACQQLIDQLNKDSRALIHETSTLRQIEQDLGEGSLIDLQTSLTTPQIKAANEQVKSALLEPLPKINTVLAKSITKAQANRLLKVVENHPVIGSDHEERYDPEGCIGFCFGRATVAHKEALRRRVHPEAVRKIWVVGPTDAGQWDFHVATIIKGPGTKWWAIDSNYDNAKEVKEWIKLQEEASDDGRLMIFVTDARRFTPFMARHYSLIDLVGDGQSDFYNSYFRDYLRHTAAQEPPEGFD